MIKTNAEGEEEFKMITWGCDVDGDVDDDDDADEQHGKEMNFYYIPVGNLHMSIQETEYFHTNGLYVTCSKSCKWCSMNRKMWYYINLYTVSRI